MSFIKSLKTVLETLNSVGIAEAIFEPHENGTLIKASNKDRTVICFHVVAGLESPVKTTIAVQSVNALLSRLNLFDCDKADLEIDLDNHGNAGSIQIKEKRKKLTYHCSNPSLINVPHRIPGNVVITGDNSIKIPSKYVDFLAQVTTSMTLTGKKEERGISLMVKDSVLEVAITDGEDDTFKEAIEGFNVPDTLKGKWDVSAFIRVLRKAGDTSTIVQSRLGCEDKEDDGSVRMIITQYRVAAFAVADLDIMVVPLA